MAETGLPIKIVPGLTGEFVVRHGVMVLAEFKDIRRAKAFRTAYAEVIDKKLGAAKAFQAGLAAADDFEVVCRNSEAPGEHYMVPGADPRFCMICLSEKAEASGACPSCQPHKFRRCDLCGSAVWACQC